MCKELEKIIYDQQRVLKKQDEVIKLQSKKISELEDTKARKDLGESYIERNKIHKPKETLNESEKIIHKGITSLEEKVINKNIPSSNTVNFIIDRMSKGSNLTQALEEANIGLYQKQRIEIELAQHNENDSRLRTNYSHLI